MKILVIRFSSLGDVILSTVIFPNLRARWPQAEITVLIKAAFVPVFDHNPNINHVRIFDPDRQPFSKLANEIRDEHFDVIIDLQGNPRSWILRLLAGAPITVAVEKATVARYAVIYLKRTPASLSKSVRERILDCLKPLEAPVVNQDTQLFPKNAEQVLLANGVDPSKKLIGVAPGAKHNTKRWPAAHFAEAANRLGALSNSMVIILGDKNDKAAAEEVSALVKTPCKIWQVGRRCRN